MDRAMQLRHLEEAERHVVEAELHITRQEQLIAELDQDGHDTTEARRLLRSFHAARRQRVEHRNRILREIEEK